MVRHGHSDVLISVSELVDLTNSKLKAKSVMSSCGRSSLSVKPISWINHPDKLDGRKILIEYNSIPKQTKSKYNLPSTKDLIDLIKQDKVLAAEDEKQKQKDLKAAQLSAILENAVTNTFHQYCSQYNAMFPGKREKTIELAKIHALIQCCIDLRGSYNNNELHAAYLSAKGVKITLKSAEKFRQKIKDFAANGIRIVHKCTGTPRAHLVKLTLWHIARIEKYYANANKYTNKIIHELLTADCIEAGKTRVSVETVAKYVAKPEVRNRLSAYRDKAYYRNNVQPSSRRKDPAHAGDLYYADGTPLQIFCWDKAEKEKIRLNLFVVMDVKSKMIMGYDLALSEDRHNWFGAFKMAFSKEMLLPHTLMHDNASATKTAEFLTLKDELLLKGCRLAPTAKGDPKQKADVERWFETFQTGFQRMIDGFTGEGVRTKRDNGRIDIEHLAHLHKRDNLYSYDDMRTIVDALVLVYNNKGDEKRKSPGKIFSESERPNTTSINHADLAMLFWMNKTLKVQKSEIEMTVRHNDYFYEVYNHELGLKLDGTKVKVYYDEKDLSTVHVFSLSGQYLCECRQKIGFYKAPVNQTDADVIQIIKQSKHNQSKLNVAKRISEQIANEGFEGDIDEMLKTANPLKVALKGVLNDAETQQQLKWIKNYNGTGDVHAYEPAAIEAIPQRKKQTAQERHSKANIIPATLEKVGKI
ncbi:transposase family protein [Mucilaginibacter gossypii]|uniref:Mu transposase C-terminal domain-containing protein n=1 Tax=Mucilaginibacter gossypii TaxID=551996 RepID=UPI000DCB2524|nr:MULTISPECIES: Mu transposase C-terminal domain-containing protein [Mucilaginibacter]QTE39506.1 transposase family protein [Mucilaginibacter gossypii]RAV56133.1 hypothetical protein DIU36_15370 [Mucilaginibacter rubeus]